MNLDSVSTNSDLNPLLLGEWKDRDLNIYVYRSNSNVLTAVIKETTGESIKIQSSQILCGIRGTTDHQIFIQKIDRVALDKIAVFSFPSKGKVDELWIFEASKTIAPLLKKGKELQKQGQQQKPEDRVNTYQKVLVCFEKALNIEANGGVDSAELKAAILKLREESFLFQVKNFSHLFLPHGNSLTAFNDIIELYENTEGLFDCLWEYLQVPKNFNDDPPPYVNTLLL